MPQLRDSGTRSLHATEPVPSAEMDGFCRIFGVETEYGVAVTGAERLVDAALNVGAQFSADWTHLTLTAPERREAILLDPFEAEPTLGFEQLMEALN